MKAALFPDARVSSAYALPYEKLAAAGYRGVIYDIDNTLVPHNAPADDRARVLFERLHAAGLVTCLTSNNKEPRVQSFAEAVQSDHYVYKAGKPGKRGYLQAMSLMGTTPETTLLIGDQIFTDVWGANRLGIATILVRKIHPREEIQIVLKRMLEFFILVAWRIVLWFRGEQETAWLVRRIGEKNEPDNG